MRLTDSALLHDTLIDLNQSQERMALYQQQLSSGRRISKPSDDPQGALTAVSEHAEAGAIDRYARATDSTTSRLTAVDTTLSDVIVELTTAKVAAAAARGSLVTPSQRQAFALQLQGVKEALVSDLNASFKGTFLFAGTKTSTQPFTVTAGSVSAYQGNAGGAAVDVDRQIALPVTFNGESITKGSDAQDVFTNLDALITAVQAGDATGIDAGLAAIDRTLGRTGQVQTTVGLSLNRLDDQRVRLTANKQAVTARLSSLEDANIAAAVTGLQLSQTAQRATLGAEAALNRNTLMDYIK
jgi:flagellar hook-associated protein 3 FlgL